MSSTARVRALTGERRNLHEQLRASEEQTRNLIDRLAAVEKQLAQRNSELAELKIRNRQLLQENRNLAGRLDTGKRRSGSSGGGGGGGAVGGGRGSGSDSDGGGGSSGGHQRVANSSNSIVDPATPTHGQHEPAIASISAPLGARTLPVGLLFPDGGWAWGGNIMTFVKHIPEAVSRDMLQKARDVLGTDVLQEFCLEAPAENMIERSVLWVLSYMASLAALEKLQREHKEVLTYAQAVAGMGNGELTALVAAGVLSFEDGLKLVTIRYEAMSEAAAVCKQAMVFVFGLQRARLEELCVTARAKEGRGAVCHVGCELFPLGFSVGGTERSIMALQGLAKQTGAVQSHNVSALPWAVFTPLMKPAEEKLRSVLLAEFLPRMNPPRITVYMQATAAPVRPGTNPKHIVDIIAKGLTSLLWEPLVKAMMKEGVSGFYELGPGTMLKDYMRRISFKTWRTMASIEA